MNESSFFGSSESRKEREENCLLLQKKIIHMSIGSIRKMYNIPQCCIELCDSQEEFDIIFKHLELKNFKQFSNLKENCNIFYMDHYTDINPQTCICHL